MAEYQAIRARYRDYRLAGRADWKYDENLGLLQEELRGRAPIARAALADLPAQWHANAAGRLRGKRAVWALLLGLLAVVGWGLRARHGARA